MNEEETRKSIQEIINSGANNIGMVMGKLKIFGNSIDMKIASQITRELLK